MAPPFFFLDNQTEMCILLPANREGVDVDKLCTVLPTGDTPPFILVNFKDNADYLSDDNKAHIFIF